MATGERQKAARGAADEEEEEWGSLGGAAAAAPPVDATPKRARSQASGSPKANVLVAAGGMVTPAAASISQPLAYASASPDAAEYVGIPSLLFTAASFRLVLTGEKLVVPVTIV